MNPATAERREAGVGDWRVSRLLASQGDSRQIFSGLCGLLFELVQIVLVVLDPSCRPD